MEANNICSQEAAQDGSSPDTSAPPPSYSPQPEPPQTTYAPQTAYGAAAPSTDGPPQRAPRRPALMGCVTAEQRRPANAPAFSSGGGFFGGGFANHCGQAVDLWWCNDARYCGSNVAERRAPNSSIHLENGGTYPADITWFVACPSGLMYRTDGYCHEIGGD